MNQFTNSTSKSSKHATFSLLGHIRSKTETDLKEKLFNTHPHCVPKKQKKTKIMQKNLKLINLLQFPYYRGKIYYIKKKITIGKKLILKFTIEKKIPVVSIFMKNLVNLPILPPNQATM